MKITNGKMLQFHIRYHFQLIKSNPFIFLDQIYKEEESLNGKFYNITALKPLKRKGD